MNKAITIHINDLPEWQKKSQFFNNFTKNEEITIPSRFIRSDDIICNLEDFITVYEISTFFMLFNPSDGLLEYLMTFMDDETYKILKNKYNPYSEIKTVISDWWNIFDTVHYNGEQNKISASLLFTKKGNLHMIEFYVRHGVPISYEHCIEASRSNRTCIEYCFSFFPIENHTVENISYYFKNAIKYKKMDCLQFLFEIFPNTVEFSYFDCNKL